MIIRDCFPIDLAFTELSTVYFADGDSRVNMNLAPLPNTRNLLCAIRPQARSTPMPASSSTG